MLTKEILQLISARLCSIIAYLVVIGVLFIILALAIMFYPAVLQVLFVVVFVIMAIISFLIAIKINHIKQYFDKFSLIFPKKKK